MQPVCFLVVSHNQVRLLPVDGNPVVDRLIDLAPALMEKIQEMLHCDKSNTVTEVEASS